MLVVQFATAAAVVVVVVVVVGLVVTVVIVVVAVVVIVIIIGDNSDASQPQLLLVICVKGEQQGRRVYQSKKKHVQEEVAGQALESQVVSKSSKVVAVMSLAVLLGSEAFARNLVSSVACGGQVFPLNLLKRVVAVNLLKLKQKQGCFV
ncbi:hypothetical protein ElyMa_000408400 [Elysia marginata]|uniref:Uncharacterized protein n=1 Tax=Elysia marginata TaxID=1093978 RepID=A0AAV4FKW3_9GAST|nr:hypothetical protein ElyMa_000408400 [Elysia marginata]